MEGVSCSSNCVARGLPHCWRLGLAAAFRLPQGFLIPHRHSPASKKAAEGHPMMIFQGQTSGCVRPEFFQICLGPSATAHPLYLVLMLLCSPVVPGGEQKLCTAPASRPHVLHRAPQQTIFWAQTEVIWLPRSRVIVESPSCALACPAVRCLYSCPKGTSPTRVRPGQREPRAGG